MKPASERARTFGRRALLLGAAKGVLLTALAGRMYYLQILESNEFKLLAEENRVNMRLLPPPRGRILDRFGVPLAINDRTYRLVVVSEQTPDLAATLDALARLIPLSEEDKERILLESRRKRRFVPIVVRENLGWDDVARIEINGPDLPGASIEAGLSRSYPYGGATAHILGYVAAVSEAELTGEPLLELPDFRIGKSGVEKQYDTILRGSAGTSRVEVNAVGRIIRELSRDEGAPGTDLVTTLDCGLQQYLQQRLASELSASAVLLDVHNGDVLALGSTPTFDPNAFNRGIRARDWQALLGNTLRPLSNKAIQGQYAPGSTFKMMVALAALEAGIKPNASFFCPGVYTVGNVRFHCWKREGHGQVPNMMEGLKLSCDVYYYDLARRVGIDAIAAMARRFGLGAPLGIDLPGERPGLIPDSRWKLATLGEKWYPGETPVAGIGQGFITTTPLQLAVMTARIANGGYAVVPHLRRERVLSAAAPIDGGPSFPSMGVEAKHLETVVEGMNRVTNDPRGTAFRSRIEEPGMEMAGKTGTAQVRRITMAERLAGVKKNEDLPWERRDHALFVGFAPVHAPRYAVAVVVEHGGGGSRVAGPIARDILYEAQLRERERTSPQNLAEIAPVPAQP